MRTRETQEQQLHNMLTTPIPKLISRLAVPTIISMLITSIYNMADTFFVSQLNTSASGATGVVFPLMCIIQAIGFSLGNGAGSNISRCLGHQDRETAEKMASTSFFTAIGCGLIVLTVGGLTLPYMVRGMGATETIVPYAIDYGKYILLGAPFMTASIVLNNTLRAQGNAFSSMIGITTGGVLNMVLDPLFIFVFDWGIAGAAIATILSQFISFCILLFQCFYTRDSIRVRWRSFTPHWAIYRHIINAGIPSFFRQGLASIATVMLNNAAMPFGDPAIAAMSIVTKVMMFIVSALLGFGQGFQPACGFNYGAGKYSRVLESFWFCVKVAVFTLTALGTLGFLFAPHVISAFRNDPQVIEVGTMAMRLQCVTLPLTGWVILCNMLFQSLGKGVEATIVAMARQGLCFIPVVLILPRTALGILGVEMAQPVADAITFLIAIPLGVHVLRQLKRQQKETEQAELPQDPEALKELLTEIENITDPNLS